MERLTQKWAAKHKPALMGEKDVAEEPNEGNYFGNQVKLAKMRGDKQADLDGDGDMEPVKEDLALILKLAGMAK